MGTSYVKSRSVVTTNHNLHLKIESPTSTEDASETPEFLSLIATVLEKTIQRNEKFVKRSKAKEGATIFHGSKAPTLSIRQYIERIFKYSKCSISCFVVAYVYMDRFLQVTNAYLTLLNVHRLLITCILVAAKFLDDVSYNNAYYAKVGGVDRAEMNKLELKLLFSLDFRLNVSLDTFNHYRLFFEKEGARKEIRRGSSQIERVVQVCGLGGNWQTKDEPCPLKFPPAHTCRAI